MKAPLIAVISVGIAAAAPAVAASAVKKETRTVPSGSVPVNTDIRQPIGVASVNTTEQGIGHRRLVRRFLKMRNRANRLIARRDHRKPRIVDTAHQVRWSTRGLARAIRVLRKRISHVRAALRDRRAGLTPAVKAILERIAACESKGNPRAIGGGGAFRGKYQFTYGAWRSVGGKGDPASASEAEQDRRAARLLKRSGTSPWPVCG
jgi:Transglycosylase-like domain